MQNRSAAIFSMYHTAQKSCWYRLFKTYTIFAYNRSVTNFLIYDVTGESCRKSFLNVAIFLNAENSTGVSVVHITFSKPSLPTKSITRKNPSVYVSDRHHFLKQCCCFFVLGTLIRTQGRRDILAPPPFAGSSYCKQIEQTG